MTARILFYFFMAIAASSALVILFSKNVFRSALSLLVTLLSIAGLFVLSYAEFVAVAQILVYAGGVLVIILFGVMLTSRISGRALIVEHKHVASGAIVGIGLLVLLSSYVTAPVNGNNILPQGVTDMGIAIFGEYALPFEVAGILLLVALVGAAVITAQLKSKT